MLVDMLKTLLIEAIALFIFMTLAFYIARTRKRLDTVDVAWGLGFILVAWVALLQESDNHSLLLTILVSIWGLRLSIHIYKRSKGRQDDRRYQELANKWRGRFWLRAYFSIFLLQGILVLAVSLPLIVATNQVIYSRAWLSVTGIVIWISGFIIETISDHQLAEFMRQKNRPVVLQTGLWRYSRHPNYFGELVQWWGIGAIALQVSYGWVGLLGPLLLSLLIIFVSGIPPIERHRAKNPEYRAYQRRTSVLVPLPTRNR